MVVTAIELARDFLDFKNYLQVARRSYKKSLIIYNYPHLSTIIPTIIPIYLQLSRIIHNYLQLRFARQDLGHFVTAIFGLPWAKLTQIVSRKAAKALRTQKSEGTYRLTTHD